MNLSGIESVMPVHEFTLLSAAQTADVTSNSQSDASHGRERDVELRAR